MSFYMRTLLTICAVILLSACASNPSGEDQHKPGNIFQHGMGPGQESK